MVPLLREEEAMYAVIRNYDIVPGMVEELILSIP